MAGLCAADRGTARCARSAPPTSRPERLKASLAASKQLGLPRYESLQPLYNLSDRKEFETDYAPICRAGRASASSPITALAAGFLTGKYRSPDDADKNPGARRAAQALSSTRAASRILKALDAVAARHNATPAQIALAWLIAQPLITAPIASATSLAAARARSCRRRGSSCERGRSRRSTRPAPKRQFRLRMELRSASCRVDRGRMAQNRQRQAASKPEGISEREIRTSRSCRRRARR